MPEVKMYALSTCSHCRNTKRFLDDLGVKYSFVDVDLLSGAQKEAIIEEMKQYNPYLTFPTLIINGQTIVGFREQMIKEVLGL